MLFHLMRLFTTADSQLFKFVYLVAVLAICIVLPFVIGRFLANRVRMQDYGWKIGLILMLLLLSCEIMGRTWDSEKRAFQVKLGVDLKGGVILIYEVEEGVNVLVDQQRAGRQKSSSKEAESDTSFEMSALVEALSRRLNPSGTKEIVIRPYGDRQVEIIIPEVDQREIEQVKKVISTAGVLQFRIVANPRDHAAIIELAKQMATNPVVKGSRVVFDEEKRPVGLWARVAREQKKAGDVYPFKLDVSGGKYTLRDASSGDLLNIPDTAVTGRDDETLRAQLAQYIKDQNIKEIDVLMSTNDGYDVNGSHLGAVTRGYDELLNPCIHFNLKGQGVGLFSELTGDNSPEGTLFRQLGIVLDYELLSAPNIQERITGRGRITGQFTQEEVDFLVHILQAGSLPVVLNKTPISESSISPLLGKETIEQGKLAITGSMVLVLVFMLVYYRFSGILACLALLANLLFTVALMVLIKAAFTLPGLAGLALTVGMAVDANVLIYERMREELARGSALRLAIRNGFARATVTIIDSNLTTVLTALILYAIGTDQLRGFAVTLTLGLLTSMFTAVFCSHVMFDIAERTRRITQLKMMRMLGVTQIDFIRQSFVAITISLVLITVGLVGFVVRGKDMFDIDFVGGTSVHVLLEKPTTPEQVRKIVGAEFREKKVQYTLTGMSLAPGVSETSIFKVDSSIPEVVELQGTIQDAFRRFGDGVQLATYSLQAEAIRTVSVVSPKADSTGSTTEKKPASDDGSKKPAAEKPAGQPAPGKAVGVTTAEPPPPDKGAKSAESEGAKPATPPAKPAEKKPDGAQRGGPLNSLLAMADEVPLLLAPPSSAPEGTQSAGPAPPESKVADTASKPSVEVPKLDTSASPSPPGKSGVPEAPDAKAAEPVTESGATSEAAKIPNVPNTLIEVPLNFRYEINNATLKADIEDAAKELGIPISYLELRNPQWQGGSNAFQEWTMRIATDEEQARKLLEKLSADFSNTPVWPSSNKIGSQVAGRMQKTAIVAIFLSWLGIIVYVWIRFQRVAFGLAAVLALVHDVLITVGAIAISTWLAGLFGFLLIEEFKINLTIVAAFLTIIGYSINDTIVIFDRIREIRGKSPKLTGEMINLSVNQTLARTLLTALTVLIVVVVMYAVGGEGIHGFAYAMLIGTISGAYSTVYIASPALLWMMGVGMPKKSSPFAG